jgi:histone deacetylase 11
MIRYFRKKRCKIVYRSEYFSGIHASSSRQTFDVMKFKKVRDELIRKKLIRRKDIITPPRLSEKDLRLVHTKEYLSRLKDPMTVGQILNLDYVNPWDNYILEFFKYVAGGTLLAAEYALEHNTTVFNLGGGYHHAQPDRGEGFCLINDVAIAIKKLHKAHRVKFTLIIDLDYHQGNGNLLFFRNDETTFTFSMHANNWNEITGKINNLDIELPSHTRDETYLDILKNELPRVLNVFQPELVFYIAGSDPYILDTLGDFDISEEGMLKRDILVYKEIRNRNLPLVVLGAGGYGPESWKIYYNFIQWVIKKGK